MTNFLLDDPLVDWLDEYGEERGFRPDSKRPGYDPRTDFSEFIVRKGRAFESAVCRYLKTLTTVHTIATSGTDAYRLEKAEETVRAMEAGVPLIYQGVLRDPENLAYGIPDILIRSDELARIFPGTIADEEAAIAGPALRRDGCRYRVIDIKFTTVHLLSGGGLGNTGSSSAYKGQLHIYNRALGRIQGYLPPTSYLLGRAVTTSSDQPRRSAPAPRR